MVDLCIEKDGDSISNELALRELGEFLRFIRDQRQFTVKSLSYVIVALGEFPTCAMVQINREGKCPEPCLAGPHGLCEREGIP